MGREQATICYRPNTAVGARTSAGDVGCGEPDRERPEVRHVHRIAESPYTSSLLSFNKLHWSGISHD